MFLSRNRPWYIITLVVLAGSFALGACNMPGRGATPTQSEINFLHTAAAETVQAQLTQINQPPATNAGQTPVPPASPASTLPAGDSATTPSPETTPQSTASAACDLVKFEQDVTYPDDAEVAPGSSFVKTWRLTNAGSCTWTQAYRLVFVSGDSMGAPASIPVTTGTVAPGGTIDLSVTMTAPASPGTYRANFLLSNPSDQRFGTGDGSKPFWVQIRVVSGTPEEGEQPGAGYDFVDRASQATWTSAVENVPGVSLTFGGADEDPNGTATIKDAMRLENGATSGKILLTFPRREERGLVSGLFPAYTVQRGDRLRARLGFMTPTGSCGEGNVIFEINYQEGNEIRPLDQWEKRCDGRLLAVDIDLSDLSGRSVQFILIVKANGSFQDDWAIWNSPRIER